MANGIFDFYYFNFRFKQQKFQNKCVLWLSRLVFRGHKLWHNLLIYTEPIPYDRMPMEIKQIEITYR